MKINYHPNPFKTTIDVDNNDKEHILLYIQNEKYLDILFSIDFGIKHKNFTIEDVSNEIKNWETICNMEITHKEVERMLNGLQEEHMGDCICEACSCTRCWAEHSLGVDTLYGLGKHSARKVFGAFGKNGNKTINEAISSLEKKPDYIKPDTWPEHVEWDKYIPKWETDRENALAWLKQYKQKHGF